MKDVDFRIPTLVLRRAVRLNAVAQPHVLADPFQEVLQVFVELSWVICESLPAFILKQLRKYCFLQIESGPRMKSHGPLLDLLELPRPPLVRVVSTDEALNSPPLCEKSEQVALGW